MPKQDNEPECSFCHAPGDFRGSACYGCIKLRELTNELSARVDALSDLRDWIVARPELNTHPFIRDRLVFEYTLLRDIVNHRLAPYAND